MIQRPPHREDPQAPELPLPPPPDPAELLAGSALADILAERIRQIADFGHTAEADALRPIHGFCLDIDARARAIREDSQFGKPAARLRAHAIRLAALCAALADRLDLEIAREGGD